MREAIGGTWIMGIVIFFIILFSSYLAISVNYSKAFKVKNGIINILEKHHGHTCCAQKEIVEYLDFVGYHIYSTCTDPYKGSLPSTKVGTNEYRYCLVSNVDGRQNAQLPRIYYSVGVFFRLDLPLLREVFTFSITGDSKTITSAKDETNCTSIDFAKC